MLPMMTSIECLGLDYNQRNSPERGFFCGCQIWAKVTKMRERFSFEGESDLGKNRIVSAGPLTNCNNCKSGCTLS